MSLALPQPRCSFVGVRPGADTGAEPLAGLGVDPGADPVNGVDCQRRWVNGVVGLHWPVYSTDESRKSEHVAEEGMTRATTMSVVNGYQSAMRGQQVVKAKGGSTTTLGPSWATAMVQLYFELSKPRHLLFLRPKQRLDSIFPVWAASTTYGPRTCARMRTLMLPYAAALRPRISILVF